jgi:hypothetical protein
MRWCARGDTLDFTLEARDLHFTPDAWPCALSHVYLSKENSVNRVRLFTLMGMALCITLGASALRSHGAAQEVRPLTSPRLGVFDSRAVAVAYTHSKYCQELLAPLREEFEKAKKEGNKDKEKELEAKGQAHQEELHRQGFGTASVANLLAHIQDQIPGIAEKAGVDWIVSRWDLVWERKGVETVDVTEALIQPFQPTESVLNMVRDLMKKAPLPLAELEKMSDH